MEIIILAVCLIAIISLCFSPVNILGYLGMFICFFLSAVGTAKGILNISRYVSGAAIRVPSVATKSIIGTVVCEANFLTGIITCVMLNSSINSSTIPKAHYLYFSSGLFVGICNYFSSVTTGLICGVITMINAKDLNIFFKIVILEIIPASVGLLGFILGIVLNSKSSNFEI